MHAARVWFSGRRLGCRAVDAECVATEYAATSAHRAQGLQSGDARSVHRWDWMASNNSGKRRCSAVRPPHTTAFDTFPELSHGHDTARTFHERIWCHIILFLRVHVGNTGFERLGVHAKPMYWRSYSADNIVETYFGLNKAVNFSTVGDPAVFARQLLLSQLAAALLVKSRIETFRSQNNFGALTWQLGEIFPTGGWGSLEYAHSRGQTQGQVRGGRWKPLHYWFESSLFQDIFVTCGKAGVCYVRNDDPMRGLQGGHVVLELMSVVTGERKGAPMVRPMSLPAGPGAMNWFCAAALGQAPDCPTWPHVLETAGCAGDRSDCILNSTVIDSSGRGLVSNPSLLAAPVVMLPKLPPVSLNATVGPRVSPVPIAGHSNPPILVTVTATAPALFVTLSTLAQGRFSRNAFFTTGGSETVEFYPIATEGDQYSILKASLKVQSFTTHISTSKCIQKHPVPVYKCAEMR